MIRRFQLEATRFKQRCRRQIDAARNAPRPAVARVLATMQIRRQRIDGTGSAIANRRQHFIPPHKKPRARAGFQRGGRVFCLICGKRAAFRHPGINAAIQNGHIINANGTHHPPNARRPLRGFAGIQHHARAIANATRRKPCRQIIRRRHGEIKAARAIGKLPLYIQKTRARNMPGIMIFPPAFDAVRPPRAGFIQKIGGAIENAELWIAQISREPFGADNRFGMDIGGHGILHFFDRVSLHQRHPARQARDQAARR